MSYSAKIICDSISETGKRLTTFEITFPRIVLAEAKTHRVIRGMGGNIEEELWLDGLGINDDENLSRNSASSRAIPIQKQIERVRQNPFIPEVFPLNAKGMQPEEYINSFDYRYEACKRNWLDFRDDAIKNVEKAIELGWHKQLANRLLEPFMWHTVIVTATEFDNFFKLRTNEQAQYEIRRIADLMYEVYHAEDMVQKYEDSTAPLYMDAFHPGFKTKELKVGEWHLPFWNEEEDYELVGQMLDRLSLLEVRDRLGMQDFTSDEIRKKVSVARCARVSYLTHDGKRDIEKDLELFERLRTSGHWSPFEHVATPSFVIADEINRFDTNACGTIGWDEDKTWMDLHSGNFIGWKQFRKEFSDENCTYFRKEN